MRIVRLAIPAILSACLIAAPSAAAAPLALLSATYSVATPPTTAGAGITLPVNVQLLNTGDEPWTTAGVYPVNLSYHWYDSSGSTVQWEGARTPLGAAVGPQTSTTIAATVIPPNAPGSYQLRFALVKEGVAWFPPSAPFTVVVQGATFTATYSVAAPPSSAPAGGVLPVPVTLTNTGNQAWNFAGANPVNLTYHWYDASGANAVVWDGARTSLGADVAPQATKAVTANVTVPPTPGTYLLRLALVKEGVTWFAPGPAMSVGAQAAYVATVTPPALPAMLAGGTYTVPVTLKNTGAAAWSSAGPSMVDVSYHWHDQSGNTVVWDGVRSLLTADVAPNATATANVKITAPLNAGTYTLTIDLVREGVGWFAQMGSVPFKQALTVEASRFAAGFALPSAMSSYWAEAKTLNVAITNTGNQTWSASGPNPVNLSYHLFNAAGIAVIWDGTRTPIGVDLLPGQTRSLPVSFVSPPSSGTFTLAIDLVREGIGWFAGTGSQQGRVALTVTSGLGGGYAATTTPGQVTIGAVVDLTVQVVNYGPRTWPAGGANPVHLGYHIYGANTGTTYVWDGARGILPTDVPANSQVTVPIQVALPSAVGDYVIAWDLVQEGVAWFSQVNVATKREPFQVVPGVVFYGSGFGHGVGMSQYGANGLAQGVTGAPFTGEQIIQKYFPNTQLAFGDAGRPFNRVLLSQPSSTSAYRCGTNRYFADYFGDVVSNAGFRVVDDANANAPIGVAGANAKWQFVARAGVIEVWNNGGSSPVRVGGSFTSVAVVPLDATQPLRFVQKDQTDGTPGFYRGNLRFSNLGNTLRVVNAVSYDDYVRGVVSFEMPKTWHPEALKAQAYAARSYGYASYRGTARDYDVSDDQADQCYAGVSAESPTTNTAVAATAGKLVTYNGGIVKTYFASSSGGYTLEFGCWGNRVVRSAGTWRCSPDASQPYLAASPDPADRLVSNPANPRASWSVTFTGSQIANAVICAGGPNIGALQGVDVSNQSPPGSGHVISVKVIGTAATADVRGEDLLRTCLGLRSTMVRLNPF